MDTPSRSRSPYRRARCTFATAAALALSQIVPAVAAAQLPRGFPLREVSAVNYGLAWALGTVGVLLLTALIAWSVPSKDAERIYDTAWRSAPRAIGIGALATFGGIATVALLAVSVIAIPMAFTTAWVVSLLGTAGFITTGWLIGRLFAERTGRTLDRRGRLIYSVAGVAVLRVLEMIPVLDVIVLFAACTLGTGALLATYAPPMRRPEDRARTRTRDGSVVQTPTVQVLDARHA